MKAFIALSCLVAVAVARPGAVLYSGLPVAGLPVQSQYHAQDELGQYSYGYAGGPSSKQEVRTADGITRGGFSYVDSNGQVQSRSYVSDPINGFRVAASDLPLGPAPVAAAPVAVAAAPVAVAAAPVAVAAGPAPVQDTVEVAAAKAQHFAAVAQAQLRNAAEEGVVVAAAPAPVAVAAAPVAVAAAPAIATPLQSQYHAQDELGQYSYGYAGALSSKNEQKTIDGVTRGAYSYVDANGLIQSRSYVSDPANGFRVAATDLPQGPAPVVAAAPVAVAAPVYAPAPIATPVVAAAPVASPVFAAGPAPSAIVSDDSVVIEGPADTPEVAIAKAAHFAAHQEAHARLANAY